MHKDKNCSIFRQQSSSIFLYEKIDQTQCSVLTDDCLKSDNLKKTY